MADDFSLVPLTKARRSLGLDEHFHNRTTLDQFVTGDIRVAQIEANDEQRRRLERKDPHWRDVVRAQLHPDFFVRHYTNHAVIAGDLDMDGLPSDRAVAGIVVDGDLELYGSIMNWEFDTNAAFLWVKGNLHCQNIVFGCMDLVVARNVTAGNLIVVTDNHGHLLIAGDVHAKYVIIDGDGASVIDGKVHARGWNRSQNAQVDLPESDWIDEIKPEFRDEFFDRRGDMRCGNGNVDLKKALLAGRDILKPRR